MLDAPKELNDLPDELLTQFILPHLQAKDVLKFSMSSKYYQQLCLDKTLWFNIIKNEPLPGFNDKYWENSADPNAKRMIHSYSQSANEIKRHKTKIDNERRLKKAIEKRDRYYAFTLLGVGATLCVAFEIFQNSAGINGEAFIQSENHEIIEFVTDLANTFL